MHTEMIQGRLLYKIQNSVKAFLPPLLQTAICFPFSYLASSHRHLPLDSLLSFYTISVTVLKPVFETPFCLYLKSKGWAAFLETRLCPEAAWTALLRDAEQRDFKMLNAAKEKSYFVFQASWWLDTWLDGLPALVKSDYFYSFVFHQNINPSWNATYRKDRTETAQGN